MTSNVEKRTEIITQVIRDSCLECQKGEKGFCEEHTKVMVDLALTPFSTLKKLEAEYFGEKKKE